MRLWVSKFNSKNREAGRVASQNNPLLETASHLDTQPNVLAELASSDDEFVRVAVALNPSTPRNILDRLSTDRSSWVTGSICKIAETDASVISIHPSPIIFKDAEIGADVVIGAYTIIFKNVEIGEGTVIGSHREIGHPTLNKAYAGTLTIGKNSYIRSHSIFYEGSSFGDNLVTGHRVTVREKTKPGMAFQIGTLIDIQGHCEIGNFVKFHSNVHIGQHSKIKNYVWIFSYVVLTKDPHPSSEVMMGGDRRRLCCNRYNVDNIAWCHGKRRRSCGSTQLGISRR